MGAARVDLDIVLDTVKCCTAIAKIDHYSWKAAAKKVLRPIVRFRRAEIDGFVLRINSDWSVCASGVLPLIVDKVDRTLGGWNFGSTSDDDERDKNGYFWSHRFTARAR